MKGNLDQIGLQRVVATARAKYEVEQQLREKQALLEELTRTDDLTGMANRRYLMESLRGHVQLATRHDFALSALMIDLDHFKKINDTHGHLTGDNVLVETARIIRSGLRETDLAGRYGGEEFCILLPHTMIEGAQVVGERIRETVADKEFKTDEGEGFRVTCSVGVAQLPTTGGTPDILLELADQALYGAKDSGRNVVVLAPYIV